MGLGRARLTAGRAVMGYGARLRAPEKSPVEGALPMPRTARVLSVAALAGATLGFASAAYADSAGEAGPSSASPGGSVTLSVACEATGGPPPPTPPAVSQANARGGNSATVDGTCATAPGGKGKTWSAT